MFRKPVKRNPIAKALRSPHLHQRVKASGKHQSRAQITDQLRHDLCVYGSAAVEHDADGRPVRVLSRAEIGGLDGARTA